MLRYIYHIIGTLLVAGYLVAFGLVLPKRFQQEVLCTGIEVNIETDEGTQKLISKEQLLAQIRLIDSLPVGKPIGSFKGLLVEKELKNRNAIISKSNLFFRPDGQLQVNVHTQLPLFLLFSGGDAYYVSKNHRKVSASKTIAVDTALPVLYGQIPGEQEKPTTEQEQKKIQTNRKQLFNIIHYVTQHDKWYGLLTDFYVDANNNLFISGQKLSYTLELGSDWSRIDEQLAELRLFLEHVEPKFGNEAFVRLSLAIPGRVVATPRNKALSRLAREKYAVLPKEEEPLPAEQEVITERH